MSTIPGADFPPLLAVAPTHVEEQVDSFEFFLGAQLTEPLETAALSDDSVVLDEELIEESTRIYNYLNSLSDDTLQRMTERDLAWLESHSPLDHRQIIPVEGNGSEGVNSPNQKSGCSAQSNIECTSKVAQVELSKMNSASNAKSSKSESFSSSVFCMLL